MNSNRYIETINNFFVPELRQKRIPTRRACFQQDEATAHTAKVLMDVLRPLFDDRLISRFADSPWPPRSPDLSV